MSDNPNATSIIGGPGGPLMLKDRYEVERELGRGGMSVVYLARDRQLMNKRVVVKVLLDESQQDAWIRKKFLQEMEALARIDHPGVVGALDTGETAEGRQFLVMQYIEGQNLRQAIANGPLEFARAANILRQIGQALSAAHEKGVWHKDLTPENIMLQKHGGGEEHVKIIDFGIAGIQDSAFGGEKTQVAGKYSYMSPEQFAGRPSAATDTYALGICAYEILTGKKPFAASLEHLVSAEKSTPEDPCLAREGLPPEAGASVLKAISFREEDRFPTARDFGEAVATALTSKRERGKDADSLLEVGHILFTDLVGYSLLPMDQQKEYIAELQKVVKGSKTFKRAAAHDDVITLPTGDGMALAFFGDPTQAAAGAFEIAKELTARPHLKLRMGIHSGPVYKVDDINANANVAGGGINMAQRVMDCGDAGHILVSEAMAATLAQLSSWKPYLVDFGNRTVKHGVILHLYNLASSELGNAVLPSKFAADMEKQGASTSKKPLIAAVAVLLLAAAGFSAWKFMGGGPENELRYSFSVQRYSAGKEVGQVVQTSGNMLFTQGDGVAVNISSPKPGNLYVLNEGMNIGKAKKTVRILSPMAANWNAAVQGGKEVRFPKEKDQFFKMDESTGSESIYVVWSATPIPDIEKFRTAPPDHGLVEIDDSAAMAQLKEFLERNGKNVTKTDDEENRETKVKGRGDILVQKILLQHQ